MLGRGSYGVCAPFLIISTYSRFWNPVLRFWVVLLDLTHDIHQTRFKTCLPPNLRFDPFPSILCAISWFLSDVSSSLHTHGNPLPLFYMTCRQASPAISRHENGPKDHAAYCSFIFLSRRGESQRALRHSSNLVSSSWGTSPPPKLNVWLHARGDMFISEISSFPFFTFFLGRLPLFIHITVNRYWPTSL